MFVPHVDQPLNKAPPVKLMLARQFVNEIVIANGFQLAYGTVVSRLDFVDPVDTPELGQ